MNITDLEFQQIINLLPLKLKDKGDYYLSKCCYHSPDKNPSLSIIKKDMPQLNRYKGNFKCWSCGESGNLNKLTKHLLNKSIYQILNIKNYDEFIFKNSFNSKIRNNEYIVNNNYNSIKIEGELKSVYDNNKVLDYLYKRNCTDEFIKFYNIQFSDYTYINGTKFINRIVIPIYFNNLLVNMEGRSIDKSNVPKVLYPKNTRTDFLFNYDNLNKNEELIVVEGFFDMVQLFNLNYKNITCMFGVSLKQNQIKQLKEFNKLNIFTDNDIAGENCLTELEEILEKEFYITRLKNAKDPGDSTKEEIIECLNNKQLSTNYFIEKSGLFENNEINWI